MRAAWYEHNGPAAQVLRVGQQPIVEPGPGEVLVRVVCSGVNPSDVKSRAGSRPVREGIVVPHSDGAGIIERGDGVDVKRVGERVWVWNAQYKRPYGTAAEYVALPAEQAVALPDNTAFDAGACLGVPALTAYHAVELAAVEPGHSVLVIGGASAVGFYAAQMARACGANVIATVGSDAKASLLYDAGFSDVIFYRKEPIAERVLAMTEGGGVNAIIDMDFSSTVSLVDQGGIAAHGRYVCYGSNDRGQIPLNFAAWLPRSLSLHFFLVYELTQAQRRRAIDGVQELLLCDGLRHHIGPRFGLEDIVAAHEAVEGGVTPGNVIVDCGDD